MGDPTSFPVMPMMSAYAAESVGHYDGKLVGDDALYGRFTHDMVLRYNAKMEGLGGKISVRKSFLHPEDGLFAEQPYHKGLPQHFNILSNWVAPPGGSKGSVNWVTQPLAAGQALVNQGLNRKRGLWKFSPFWQFHKAAFILGLPIGAPPDFGGLNHPLFPKSSTRFHFYWLTYLSGLSLDRLIGGTGLSIVRNPHQAFRQKGAEFVAQIVEADNTEQSSYSDYITHLKLLGEDTTEIEADMPAKKVKDLAYDNQGRLLPDLTQIAEEAARPLISWELYFRGTIKGDKTPSLRRSVQRFSSRVTRIKSPPISGTYENVRKDIARKKSKFLARSVIPSHGTKSYGLERTELPKKRVKYYWHEGRELWA